MRLYLLLQKAACAAEISDSSARTRAEPFIGADNETLSVAMCVCNPDGSPLESIAEAQPASLVVQNRLRRRLVHFKLCTHLLQSRSKRFNLLLLFRELGLKVLLLLHHSCF